MNSSLNLISKFLCKIPQFKWIMSLNILFTNAFFMKMWPSNDFASKNCMCMQTWFTWFVWWPIDSARDANMHHAIQSMCVESQYLGHLKVNPFKAVDFGRACYLYIPQPEHFGDQSWMGQSFATLIGNAYFQSARASLTFQFFFSFVGYCCILLFFVFVIVVLFLHLFWS